MTEETRQITADNLRADFLNATTNWQRWKVLNRALQWALDASENAEHLRQQVQELKGRVEVAERKHWVRHGERVISDGDRTVRAGDVVTWDGDIDGWIVRAVGPGTLVTVAPLGDDWRLGEHQVSAEILLDVQEQDFET